MIWGTLGSSRSFFFVGIQENNYYFIIMLRWYVTFMLSCDHKNTVEFSRRYMTCDDIITNDMFVYSCFNMSL